MSKLLAEYLGTALLILLGDGVVANVVLNKSKAQNAGWMVVATGWGLAVTLAVYCFGSFSGGHFNPAVTLAMAAIGKFESADVAGYIAAQMAGGFTGAVLVWLAYLPHWRETADPAGKLGVFCTAPAIRNPLSNLICEIIGTFVLVLGVLAILTPENLIEGSGFKEGFGPLLVGFIVLAIGISLGGPTGYAINPARDFAPRLAHALLPIAGKGGSDWAYAWIPIVGPVIGGVAAGFFYKACWPA